jgi:Fe-S-cluster containining protein
MRQDAQLLQIVDAALADAAMRAGEHLVCRPGCTQCCYGAFAIGPVDALRLRTGLAELAAVDPEKAEAIAERARLYLAEFGAEFPGDPASGILGTSMAEQAAFEDFANEAPCPALNPDNGLCELYAARPMACRVFGPPVRIESHADGEDAGANGFAVCELCFTDATPEEVAAAEMFIPYSEEQRVTEALFPNPERAREQTIIAFCLTLAVPALLQPGRESPS